MGSSRFIDTQVPRADIRVVRETSTTEPVTLAEARNYLRITNTQDDDLVASMITSARRQAEEYINSDIVPKERIYYLTKLTEGINLPYAPIASVDSFTIDGTAQTVNEGYEILGLDNPVISLNGSMYGEQAQKVEITYTTAGITSNDIKIGILALIAWMYHGRDAKMSTNYKSWLSPFKTVGYYGIR